jgi:cobalt-zinc-cadmium efflux system outer membrane protein
MKRSRVALRIALILALNHAAGCLPSRHYAHRPAWLNPHGEQAEIERAASSQVPGLLVKPVPSESLSKSPFQLAAYSAAGQADDILDLQPSPSDYTGPETTGPEPAVPALTVSLQVADRPIPSLVRDEVNPTSGGAAMSLGDFESMAMANNPTLRELAFSSQRAAGYRTQVGLRPNPNVGYQAVQLADQSTDQHTAFVEQEIVRGEKLQWNRRVLNEAVRAQNLELDTQRWRVATDIRAKFYLALAAQRRLELIQEFQGVTNTGLELAELRKEAMEGSQIDVLQAKVQKNEIDLAKQQAEVVLAASWRELAALAGVGNLTPARLLGDLPHSVESLDWPTVADDMLQSSPERQVAMARVAQARANLQRQNIQPIPNLTLLMAAGVDNGTNSGMMNVQVGAPIPVFNQNQGNIAAARAEYCRNVLEVERIENSIKARLAEVSAQYDSALAAVTNYAAEILPNAEESMRLAELAYKAGETNFIQVLVARRTYFDSNLMFVQAQGQLAQARAMVDGYVLSGGLDPINDQSGDDSLRGQTFSQQ